MHQPVSIYRPHSCSEMQHKYFISQTSLQERDILETENPPHMHTHEKPSDRPSNVFLISALQFPLIWDLTATSSASKTAEHLSHLNLNAEGWHTHISEHKWRRIRHGKRPQERKVRDSAPLSERSIIQCTHQMQLLQGARPQMWNASLALFPWPQKTELFVETAFSVLTNQTKPLTGSPPRTLRKDDVSVSSKQSWAPPGGRRRWMPSHISWTLKWWRQTSSEELWSMFHSRMVPPVHWCSTACSWCPLLLCLLLPLRHPGTTTALESSLFVHLHICAFPDVCLFLFSFIPLSFKKKKSGCNKERKQAVWALKGRNKKIKCEVGSAVEVSQGGCFVKAAQTGFSQTSLKAVLTRRCWQSEGGRTEGGQKGEGGEFENCIHTPTCAWVQKNRIL